MPRKSTKVVNTDVSTSEIATATAPAPEPDTKKKAPVKRVSKKINVANTNDKDANTLPTTNVTSQTAVQPPSIQVSDNVNTFNIHIKHVSDDGSNIENTFSTTYTHTSRDSDGDDHDDDDDDDDDVHNNNNNSDSDSDSDGDSDYDTKFENSSLSLPVSSSADMNSLLAFASAVSALSEDENPLYMTRQINYDILIPFVLINMHASSRENILALLHTTLISCIEGRCITEGYIKPHSTRIIDFKCGKIIAKNVQFNIVIECLVCNPPTNSVISCVAKNITQAGIRAVSDDEYSPVVVYITRDFGIDSDKTYYNSIKEGDKINIKVVGKRFEMNDKNIQIIGFLVQPKKDRISLTSHSKKLISSSVSMPRLATESAEPSSATNGRAKAAQTRGPRKTKNPLSIINDTDNNVITITYDPTIDLPKASKAPKESKEPKEPKAVKTPKVPKEPKAVKTSKKENVGAGAVTAVTTNE
jgi:hypothetical protein